MTRRWRMKEHQAWWYCSNFSVTNPTWSAQERERERECEFTQPRGKLYCSEVARSQLTRLKGIDQQNMKSIYSPSCCSKSVWLSFTKGEFLNNTLEAIFKYSKSENALKWKEKPCELQNLAFDTCQFLHLGSNNIDIITVKFDLQGMKRLTVNNDLNCWKKSQHMTWKL